MATLPPDKTGRRQARSGSIDAVLVRAGTQGVPPYWVRSDRLVPAISGFRSLTAARPLKNQLQPLHKAAGRLGWTVMAAFRDEGVSGTKGRDKRPGLDALLKDDPFLP